MRHDNAIFIKITMVRGRKCALFRDDVVQYPWGNEATQVEESIINGLVWATGNYRIELQKALEALRQ